MCLYPPGGRYSDITTADLPRAPYANGGVLHQPRTPDPLHSLTLEIKAVAQRAMRGEALRHARLSPFCERGVPYLRADFHSVPNYVFRCQATVGGAVGTAGLWFHPHYLFASAFSPF